jgi:hypothetical protein
MRYIISLTTLFFAFAVFAQTPSERRAKRLEEEAAAKNQIFDKHTASLKEVPQKFANESVVVLFLSENFQVKNDRLSRGVPVLEESVKRRVYLKDKVAVEEFSTIYTGIYDGAPSSQITVIKPNGTTKTLTLKDGITVTDKTTIPITYKSSLSYSHEYLKFAIADLEPGDIIDILQTHRTPVSHEYGHKALHSTIYLASKYPVAKKYISITIPSKCYMYIKSVNGAPEFNVTNNADGSVNFSMEDSLRDKIINDWNLPSSKYLPHVKFNLSNYEGNDINDILPIKMNVDKKIINGFTDKDFIRASSIYYTYKYYEDYAPSYADQVIAEVILKHPEVKRDPNKIIELSWYLIRLAVLNGSDIGISSYTPPQVQKDVYMIAMMMHILQKQKQTFDLIMTTGNNSSDISSVVSPTEISWIIKWNNKYISYPSYYMQFGELLNQYQGANALSIQNFTFNSNPRALPVLNRIVLPIIDYKENSLTENLTISFNDEFDKINCKRNVIAKKGFSKHFISDYYFRDFGIDQQKYLNLYTPVDSVALYRGMNNVRAAELRRKNNAEIAEGYKAIKEEFTDNAKALYPTLDTYKSWSFVGYGITPNSVDFNLTEEFTLNDLIKKAGNGYIVRIGALVGNYEKFVNDELKRNYPGSLDLISTKTFNITFTIPDGYKVVTNDNSKKTYSDNLVSVQSNITVSGDKVVFNITRDLKNRDFSVTEYQSIVKLYDLMYELTQTQIVLKKN